MQTEVRAPTVMVFDTQPRESVAPGVIRSRLAPGGKDGPDGIVRDAAVPGGATWSESWSLGRPEDPWRLTIPDIRMAANQLWPRHWHDCWTAVVVLDGSVMIGDWWMGRGDVLIAAPGIEYGLLLNGPRGCQLLEIFARDVLAPGGYGTEYRDHPTLVYVQGTGALTFRAGATDCQCIPCDGRPGLQKGHLDGASRWDLGEPDDPERGILWDARLSPGAERDATTAGDWRALLVLDGTVRAGGTELTADDLLVFEPGATVPALRAGATGAHLLEVARTAAAA